MDEKALYKTLGETVAARRKELGLKQSDLAQRIGLSRASVANIEVGRQKVLLHQAYQLALALDLAGMDALLPMLAGKLAGVEPIPFAEVVELTAAQRAQIESFVRVNPVVKTRRRRE